MTSSLGQVYEAHHAKRRGEGFVLLGDERGAFLKEVIGTGKGVLDIGCRDGALTASFAEGNTVVGLDIDAAALTRARESLSIETRQVDLNGDWGIEPRSFDVVVAAEVIEHLYHPSLVIEKVAQSLKEGGIFVGTVPNAFSLINRCRYLLKKKKGTPLEDPTHINHFAVAELEALLKERFAVVEMRGYGRLGWLAHTFPQMFAFGLSWVAYNPRRA